MQALSFSQLGAAPILACYWIVAVANGTASTNYPSGNGVSGQGLAPVAPTSLTLVGFPTFIRAIVGGSFTPGTIVKVFEYTANTPFASATEIARGENHTVFNIPRRDTTTRYYWVQTELSGRNSTEYPSGNGTAGAADQAQTGDIAAGAATEVFGATDAGGTISVVGTSGDVSDDFGSITHTPSANATALFSVTAKVISDAPIYGTTALAIIGRTTPPSTIASRSIALTGGTQPQIAGPALQVQASVTAGLEYVAYLRIIGTDGGVSYDIDVSDVTSKLEIIKR